MAQFLGVNPSSGLFYFGADYRPVPLSTQFIGVAEHGGFAARGALMNQIAYLKVALRDLEVFLGGWRFLGVWEFF